MERRQRRVGTIGVITTAGTVGLIAGDIAVIGGLRPDPSRLGRELSHPYRWVGTVGADRAVAELAGSALWLAAVWLAVGLLATVLTALPGRVGELGDRAAALVLPAVVRRLIATSLGLGLAIGPVGSAVAATAAPGTVSATSAGDPAARSSTTTAVAPDIGWPTSTDAAPPGDIPWPSTPSTPSPPASSSPANPIPASPTVDHVTVLAGDSLWTIAARRIGPTATPTQIAAAWPQWYRANAAVVGADPALLLPGQVLAAPESTGSTE